MGIPSFFQKADTIVAAPIQHDNTNRDENVASCVNKLMLRMDLMQDEMQQLREEINGINRDFNTVNGLIRRLIRLLLRL